MVHADAVNYQALKYGTNSESLASGYYVKPATVTVNGDQYLVTMTIHTATNLGKWPVTVLSINGTGPANVAKTQSASGYDYQYAFETKDLAQTINSSIAINVPNVYVANHDISFKFDTSHLPSLATAASTAAASSQPAQAASSSAKSASASSATTASSAQQQAGAAASRSSRQKQTQAAKQAARRESRRTQKQVAQIKALNRQNQQTQQAILVGGVVAVIILGAAAYFFVKRQR
ncbi:MAG: NEAT domain-containing protein [Lactobacillus sp.]|nr:NEAT domain-containing protein [Lactobacillus sp.]